MPSPSVSGTSICTWSMKFRFQIGSNRPLPKRNARMFCAASLPRKWSIRKIWSSAKYSCSCSLSDTALSRSVPKGFSMMMRQLAVRSGLGQQPHGRQGRAGRHAQIVHAAALAAQRLLGPLAPPPSGPGARRQGT